MSGHSKEWYLELAFKKAHRWLRRGRLSNNEAVFVRGAVRCLKGMEKKTRRACSNFMPDDVMRCGPLTKRFKDKGLPAVYIPSEPVSVSAAM